MILYVRIVQFKIIIMVFDIKNGGISATLMHTLKAYQHNNLSTVVPKGFSLVLSPESLSAFNREAQKQGLLAANYTDEVRFMNYYITIEQAENWPNDKIALVPDTDLELKANYQVVIKDFYPFVYTRPQDGLLWMSLGYYHYVYVAHFQKYKGKIDSVDKALLWHIESTGARWVIIEEPTFSPFACSVAVYEPDYYNYLFKTLDFDTAVRFSGDHAIDKLEQRIQEKAHLWKK